MRVLSVLLALVNIIAFSNASHAMDIVSSGVARAVIVVPASASPVTLYAAKELQWHIREATGVELTIIPEGIAYTEDLHPIYLGSCVKSGQAGMRVDELPSNTFQIKITPDAMFLAGRDGSGTPPFDDVTSMGTLFAVYEWLDEQMGVKWLWPGKLGTYVPKQTHVTSGPESERTEKPPFLHTKLRFGGGGVFGAWRDVVSKQARDGFMHDTSVWLRRHRFTRPVSFEYGHAFEKYWERFGKEHPEWFALRPDGKRGPTDAPVLVQMCVSNPDLHKQIIADWLGQRKAGLPWINGAENDKRGNPDDPPCTCEKCRAWDPVHPQILSSAAINLIDTDKKETSASAPEISLSDRYARFWLALQAEGRKHDPEATVVGYAYAGYSEPPLETKLNDHIIVWIVPPYRLPLGTEEKERFQKLWDGWAKTGARLVLRPNYTLEGDCMPYIYAEQFGHEFQFAAKHGLIGTDFDSLTSMWAVQGPNLYMLGRIQEKPHMKVDVILDEYYSAFGAASGQVRAYFQHWEQVTSQLANPEFVNSLPSYSFTTFQTVADKIFTPETFVKGRKLLQEALAAAAQDPEATARVEYLRKGLEHAELSLHASSAFQAVIKSPEPEKAKQTFLAALKALDDYRKSIESDNVVDIVYLNFCENNRGYGRKQIQLIGQYEKIEALPLVWSFQWDPKGVGLAEKWYDEKFDSGQWLKARTDLAWEKQPVGEQWKENHGKDYDGFAWYRTTFGIPKKYQGRKILLTFGAVDEACRVWVNGSLVLERPYKPAVNPNSWNEPFVVDITNAARFDQLNVVAVQVEDSALAGGIWQPCSLVAE